MIPKAEALHTLYDGTSNPEGEVYDTLLGCKERPRACNSDSEAPQGESSSASHCLLKAGLLGLLPAAHKLACHHEQLAVEVAHLRGAIMTQTELHSFYNTTRRQTQDPATYDFSSQEWQGRCHWASQTRAWAQLTDEERQAAQEKDFTVLEVPIDWGEWFLRYFSGERRFH